MDCLKSQGLRQTSIHSDDRSESWLGCGSNGVMLYKNKDRWELVRKSPSEEDLHSGVFTWTAEDGMGVGVRSTIF